MRPERHRRRSIRLKGYNYSQAGAYFITICTQGRECLFGQVIEGVMQLNEYGWIVHDEWVRTADVRPNVELDLFVVMPNHLHIIVVIHSHDGGRGVLQYAPTSYAGTTENQTSRLRSPSQTIGAIVRGFKSASTKRINELRKTPGAAVWQRNYFEHIIRDDESLHHIRQYIVENPLRWHLDAENPNAIGTDEQWNALFVAMTSQSPLCDNPDREAKT
jgi:REP element-mobilizing transposase RayT